MERKLPCKERKRETESGKKQIGRAHGGMEARTRRGITERERETERDRERETETETETEREFIL